MGKLSMGIGLLKRRSTWMILFIMIAIGMGLTPAQPLAAQSEAGTVVHTVNWGETLYSIARQYGVSPQSITEANTLAAPDTLYAGQELIIPGAVVGSGSVPTTSTGSSDVHIVQSGENLYRIGLLYNLSIDALMQANNLPSADAIYVGQRLSLSASNADTVSPSQADSVPVASIDTHLVQAGETLGGIAATYGVSDWAITQVNTISNPSLIYVGQVLTLPTGASARSQPIPTPEPVYNFPTPSVLIGKQIIVDLSDQRTYAFENGQLVRGFTVSTGLPLTPTVLGDYAVYIKRDSQTMSGPGYSLPGVPWIMYFYRGYGFHGTYWHNNFGQPMSHGCVNMTIDDAYWLYNWAPMGTPVRVIW